MSAKLSYVGWLLDLLAIEAITWPKKVENQPRFAELQYGIKLYSLQYKKEIVKENQKKFLKIVTAQQQPQQQNKHN